MSDNGRPSQVRPLSSLISQEIAINFAVRDWRTDVKGSMQCKARQGDKRPPVSFIDEMHKPKLQKT